MAHSDYVDLLNQRELRTNTDAQFAPGADGLTLTGPAAIAVSAPANSLPCGLANASCTSQTGLLACADEFYANDRLCGTAVPHQTFTHFTALPAPNDYQGDCFADAPPCTATASKLRYTTDADGNILMPILQYKARKK